ncbi:MAG TPA: glutamate--cysteine ligase [Candidatus Competibacteraceae bacterium]|nr:glutamate--cysteine ligase [Candidatus Competibacteraceae bacterium]
MSRVFEKRLSRFINAGQPDLLQDALVGLEKETLRVSSEGLIAQTPHPEVLGSALTHPYITTDYSEALLEFITPPFPDPRQTLDFLEDIHRFVYNQVREEMLWATSMPCVVAGETSIPIARYGSSNAGRMKHLYRVGLGYRYGKVMQVISGVHFNFSMGDGFWEAFRELEQSREPLQDFRSAGYFALCRNLLRLGWLIPYLFGASPALCRSFLGGRLRPGLVDLDGHSYGVPQGTSLRLSDLGYSNQKSGFSISYNSLEQYIKDLTWAISTPSPRFQAIGVKVNGEYRQLNANLLQIENEYYATIRPKQVLQGEEKPTLALHRRGVQYVELRSLDVSPFAPLGVSEEQMRFVQALLLYCLFAEAPPLDPAARDGASHNQLATAMEGRAPGFTLNRDGRAMLLRDWGLEVCDALQGFCELLDLGHDERPYQRALEQARAALRDPALTPSARVLAEMRERDETFFQFARRWSLAHQAHFTDLGPDPERTPFFVDAAAESIERQRRMEASDRMSFDEYLQHYFEQHLP